MKNIICNMCSNNKNFSLCISGQHIRINCGQCQQYIKFAKNTELPNLVEIRKKIWALSGNNVGIIEFWKQRHGFKPENGKFTSSHNYCVYYNVLQSLKFRQDEYLEEKKIQETEDDGDSEGEYIGLPF